MLAAIGVSRMGVTEVAAPWRGSVAVVTAVGVSTIGMVMVAAVSRVVWQLLQQCVYPGGVVWQ